MPLKAHDISMTSCMQGWGWSTDEEPDPGRAVMPRSAGRHGTMMLRCYTVVAVAFHAHYTIYMVRLVPGFYSLMLARD